MKFVYKNKRTLQYYTYNGDVSDLNKADCYDLNTYLIIGAIRTNNSSWKTTDRFGRNNKDYIKVLFEEEVKQYRKLKLNKIKNI